MLAFIDSSGDPGRKLWKNSSRFLVTAVVVFDDIAAANCDRAIDQLRVGLSLPFDYEFHFARNSNRIRGLFLEEISKHPFSYYVFALEKRPDVLEALGLATNTSVVDYAITRTIDISSGILLNARVVIDGNKGDREFRNRLKVQLRRAILQPASNRFIREVRIRDSRKDNLLQVADYIAGISNREISGSRDGADLSAVVQNQRRVVEVWPKT